MAEITPKLQTARPSARTVTGWTILFMVLLRVAIGWHFLYEGIYKMKEGNFTSTPYLAASVGPVADTFRGMIWDADGLERLTKESIDRRIDARFDLIVDYYGLTEDQKKAAAAYRDRKKHGDPNSLLADKVNVDYLFPDAGFLTGLADEARKLQTGVYNGDPYKDPVDLGLSEVQTAGDLQRQLDDYKKLLKHISDMEAQTGGPHYDMERLKFDKTKRDKDRASLLTRVEEPLKDMERHIMSGLTADQLARGPLPGEIQSQNKLGRLMSKVHLPMPSPESQTYTIDVLTMYGLAAVGICLILGLFTRLAALGAAVFLAMFYFSMPPWPGLPDIPMTEGHYLIVNKNLIELIAVLMIAASRVGRWMGLDAYLSALCRRGRDKTEAAATAVNSK